MKKVTRRIIDNVCYITQVFEPGDVLPVHNHLDKPENKHITVITNGRFEILGERAEQIVNSGDVIEWRVDEDHGLRAVTSGTFMNIRMSLPKETQSL